MTKPLCLPLFTKREGNPGARVTLVGGLPEQSHISSFFKRRTYKAERVTLGLGKTYLSARFTLTRGLPYLPLSCVMPDQ